MSRAPVSARRGWVPRGRGSGGPPRALPMGPWFPSGPPATLLVTTDHGRSTEFSSHGGEYPESSRVFLVAAGSGIRARGFVPARAHRLADVGQTIRALVELPLVSAPRAGQVVSELFM